MIETIFGTTALTWIDMVNPTRQELEAVAKDHGLHSTSLNDCLEPKHLPKFEQVGDYSFLIIRSFDQASTAEADTVQELTRKLAIFFRDGVLITIHRTKQPYLDRAIAEWKQRLEAGQTPDVINIVTSILSSAFATFDSPINDALARLDDFEMAIFGISPAARVKLQEGYYLKRRASVFKRIIWLSSEVLGKLRSSIPSDSPFLQDSKDLLEHLHFHADELSDGVTSLLSLHISIASQKTNEASRRTNEVMRVLTVFSVFFLPLNFIAGVYGMNFAHMPELRWQFGYPLALSIMAAVAAGLFVWFRRRGWLK